ncbi:MAG: hypothetical protein ACI9TY_001087 [Alphaproteobacteria bacterium]|jgi:hypothetical protein
MKLTQEVLPLSKESFMAESNTDYANDFWLNRNAASLTVLMESAKADVQQVLDWIKEARKRTEPCECCGNQEFYAPLQVFCQITMGMKGQAGKYTKEVLDFCVDTMLTAEKPDLGHFYSVGSQYVNGRVTQDGEQKGFEVLLAGVKNIPADCNDKYAMGQLYYGLGYCYYNGVGTAADKDTALHYFAKGAKCDHKKAV